MRFINKIQSNASLESFVKSLNNRSWVSTARQEESEGLYISGWIIIFEKNSLLEPWIRFFVWIKSAFVDVNTQIFLPAYSLIDDNINSDFPYEVGAIMDIVRFCFSSKKSTNWRCCSLWYTPFKWYCSVKASFHSVKKFLWDSSVCCSINLLIG